jgi:hypothetical protein
MEKRNIVETGRTPDATEKTAEVVEKGAALFRPVLGPRSKNESVPVKKETTDADGKTVD